jgi:hypothetical protein
VPALNIGLVHEQWYLAQYPDVAEAVRAGKFRSGEHHYVAWGIMEGRLPRKPAVDEAWYLATYPDVASAVGCGRYASGRDHYVQDGWREGRRPRREE